MRKSLLLLLSLLFCIGSYATEKEVDVQEPGKLKKLIDKKEYLDITSLTIKGEINDKDMKVIECLTNLVSLDMSDVKGRFYYFPTLPKLKTLYLPQYIGDNYRISKGKEIHISDCILTNTSLQTIYMTSSIARNVGAMPNLHKVGLYNVNIHKEESERSESIPIDTIVIWGEHNDLFANSTFCGYLPKIVLNRHTKSTILNAFEPNRTDYKGINILPVLREGQQVNTPEILDLSDVVSIPARYFRNGTMKKLVLSEQLQFIGDNAFENCNNLKEVTFPGKTVSLEMYGWAFNGCSNLKYVHFLGSVQVRNPDSVEGNHCVVEFDKPSSICIEYARSPFEHFVFNAVPVEFEIGDGNCEFTNVVLYVEIPKGSKDKFLALCSSAERRADYEKCIFEQGAKLKSYDIKVEKPGTILSYLPMTELESIDSLTITGFLYETDIKVIEKCHRLSYLNLGKTVVTYSPELLKEQYAEREALGALFGMLGAMADAQYDNYEMGALDHAYTKALVSLVQQDAASVKKGSEKSIIPAGSFSKMNFLKTVILPYRVVQIRDKVLSDCPNLEHVELPLYLESIGKDCFKNCARLKDIKFPQSLNSIGNGCFKNCNSIEVVDLSHCLFTSHRNYVSWDDVFANCLRLKELRLPQGITYLSSIRCAERINENNPHILKVYFPETAKKGEGIKLHNYGNCELHFKSENAPESLGEAASGCKVVIYCPKGSTTSYFNAVGGKLERIKIIEE